MQKSAKNQGATARRKIKASTVKSRKDVRRPNRIQKQSIKIIDRDETAQEPARELKTKKQIKILPIEQIAAQEIAQQQAQFEQKIQEQQVKQQTQQAQQVEQQAQAQQTQQVQQVRQAGQQQAQTAPDLARVHERMRARTVAAPQPTKLSAKEIKDREIKKAISKADNIAAEKKTKKPAKIHFGVGRVVLALSCAAAAVFAIVYFVNLSAPDLSLRVAAMQTGIEASYPSYVPRDFSLSDITSENGKITMSFINRGTGEAFTLVEEKSSWDSNALLENFVRREYGEDYAMVRENGLTLYIKDSDAAWVNGGMVFKLKTTSGTLTKKQIRAIAVSL